MSKLRASGDQLGFFGDEPARSKKAPYMEAMAQPEQELALLRTLADALPPDVRFGTSSWTYPGWRGLSYFQRYDTEKQFMQQSLAEYARHPLFRTAGVDRGYYAPVPKEELAHYAAQVPDDFRFVSKVWSEITAFSFPMHARYGARAGQRNESFLDARLFDELVLTPSLEALGRKQGPFVLEMPSMSGLIDEDAFLGKLDHFLSTTDGRAHIAVELRDVSFLTRRYAEVLRAHDASHVFNAWSRMPDVMWQQKRFASLAGQSTVMRLLMPQGGDYETLRARFSPFDRVMAPQPAMLQGIVDLIERARGEGKQVFAVIGNKLEGSAPRTVLRIADLLARRLSEST